MIINNNNYLKKQLENLNEANNINQINNKKVGEEIKNLMIKYKKREMLIKSSGNM